MTSQNQSALDADLAEFCDLFDMEPSDNVVAAVQRAQVLAETPVVAMTAILLGVTGRQFSAAVAAEIEAIAAERSQLAFGPPATALPMEDHQTAPVDLPPAAVEPEAVQPVPEVVPVAAPDTMPEVVPEAMPEAVPEVAPEAMPAVSDAVSPAVVAEPVPAQAANTPETPVGPVDAIAATTKTYRVSIDGVKKAVDAKPWLDFSNQWCAAQSLPELFTLDGASLLVTIPAGTDMQVVRQWKDYFDHENPTVKYTFTEVSDSK